MSEAKKLFEVAKELNISTQTVLDVLEKNGFRVSRGPNTKITPEMYSELKKPGTLSFKLKRRAGPNNKNVNIKAWQINNKKPRHFMEINGWPVVAFYTYYPKGCYVKLNELEKKQREFVLDFKKGRWDAVHFNIAARLLKEHFRQPFDNVLLCCIPASKAVDNQIRYKEFLIDLENNLKILNGYGAIQRRVDRESMNIIGHDQSRIEGVYFKGGTLKGRDVVLLDDVITTGKSFDEYSTELMKHGVKSVSGIMFAKTSRVKVKQGSVQ